MSSAFTRCLIAMTFLPFLAGSAMADCANVDSILSKAYPQATGDDSYNIPGPDYARTISSDQVVCKPWPYRPGLTLAAVPLIEANPGTDADPRGDVELLAIDDRSGAVVARHVEKGAADSNAIAFSSIDLDIGRYDLTPKERAFGLRVTVSHSGSGFGFSEEALWLYRIEGSSIVPLLKGLVTISSNGQDSGDCDSTGNEGRSSISMGKPGGGGLNDLIIKQTEETRNSAKSGAECKDETTKSSRVIAFHFDGKAYVPPPGTDPKLGDMSLFSELASPPADDAAPRQTPKPSFDCAKAVSPEEKAICADRGLAAADLAMSQAYDKLLGQLDSVGAAALKADQGGFIATRNTRFSQAFGNSGPESMRDEIEVRTGNLERIDPTPSAGFAGEWTSLDGSVTVAAKGGAYTLSLTTSNAVTGGSMCQIEAEGKLVGDELVVDTGQNGWLVKARRDGPLLDIRLLAPATGGDRLPAFCAQGGKIGGVMFATQRAKP